MAEEIKPTTTKKAKAVKPKDLKEPDLENIANDFSKLFLSQASNGNLNTDVINSFATQAKNREQEYELIDTMAQDSTIAAALELYAQDITQPNDNGKVFWVEVDPTAEDSSELLTWAEKKLDALQVDKQAFEWAFNLVKYGDVYVKPIRKSDYEKSVLFKQPEQEHLNEDIRAITKDKDDKYLEMIETERCSNEIFDLTQLGKTVCFIKAGNNTKLWYVNSQLGDYYSSTTYQLHSLDNQKRSQDIDFHPATDYVHACLSGADNRAFEEVSLFKEDLTDEDDRNTSSITPGLYTVKRGTGILNNLFKTWRELNLLETSVLMSRITKSEITTKMQVEVGDMDQQQAQEVMLRVKQLFEQKRAVESGTKMSEYVNPGPMENRVYIPTRNGLGAVTTETVGGDFDPKALTDLDWFNNKLFGALGIPKQFFDFVGDNAGFSGGQSLSIISSQYGKKVKRYQQVLCQMVKDLLTIYLFNDHLDEKWLGKFTVKMQAPVTQEEIDKINNVNNALRNASDVVNALGDLVDKPAKLKIMKSLLTGVITDQSIMKILDEQIDKLEKEEADTNSEEPEGPFGGGGFEGVSPEEPGPRLAPAEEPEEPAAAPEGEENLNVPGVDFLNGEGLGETSTGEGEFGEALDDDRLPSFEELGIDGTKSFRGEK